MDKYETVSTLSLTPTEMKDLTDRLLPNLPSGPLDTYRKKASFDWKTLKLVLEGQSNIDVENKIYAFLMEDPLFRQTKTVSNLNETRRLSFLRLKKLISFLEHAFQDAMFQKDGFQVTLTRCIGMYDWSLYIKYALSNFVFKFMIMTSTQDYHLDIYDKFESGNVVGCLMLTELGHGSNLKKLQTRAVYDPNTQEFVLNSPTLESTKCWSGNLGHHATHGIVYAQLYTSDDVCHGLHSFAIALRDPMTHIPYPGVIIGDMGPKIGLDGIDNGFLRFEHYRVPRESLFNRLSDVTADGKFVSTIKDNNRFGAALANLSAGRCAIIRMCCINLMKALIIGVRYSGTRRQFGPTADEEVPIWEYQLQRWRLLPYVSAVYVLDVFSKYICETFRTFALESVSGGNTAERRAAGVELHCLSCAVKPLSGWTARDGIQECREACGGHGYLKNARIGDIRNDHDANLTYEGDNNVLLQQTSQTLMLQLKLKRSGQTVSSPLNTFDFINDIDNILRGKLVVKSIEDFMNPKVCLDAYKWLICYLMIECDRSLNDENRKGSDTFTAYANCQAYRLRNLAIVFAEHAVLQHFYQFASNQSLPREVGDVFRRVCSLYGLWSLEKHVAFIYEGSYLADLSQVRLIKDAILRLCSELKYDAISLMDVFAPPDSILNSAIGVADGEIYKSLYGELVHRPGAFEIPSFMDEVQSFSADLISKL